MSEFDCPKCGERLFECYRCKGVFSVEKGVADVKGEAFCCVACQRELDGGK